VPLRMRLRGKTRTSQHDLQVRRFYCSARVWFSFMVEQEMGRGPPEYFTSSWGIRQFGGGNSKGSSSTFYTVVRGKNTVTNYLRGEGPLIPVLVTNRRTLWSNFRGKFYDLHKPGPSINTEEREWKREKNFRVLVFL